MARITINGNVIDIEGDGVVIESRNGEIRVNGNVAAKGLVARSILRSMLARLKKWKQMGA